MHEILEGHEDLIYEGRIAGVFTGFRNHDTIFKLQGGISWRQVEYHFEYHYRDSPRVKIVKITNKEKHKEAFYIEVDGVKTRVEVKSSYA